MKNNGKERRRVRLERAIQSRLEKRVGIFAVLRIACEDRDEVYKALEVLRGMVKEASVRFTDLSVKYERSKRRSYRIWREVSARTEEIFKQCEELEREIDYTYEQDRQFQIELAGAKSRRQVQFYSGKMRQLDEYRASLQNKIKSLMEKEKAERSAAFIKTYRSMYLHGKLVEAKTSLKKLNTEMSATISDYKQRRSIVDDAWRDYAAWAADLLKMTRSMREYDEAYAEEIIKQYSLDKIAEMGISSSMVAKIVISAAKGTVNAYFGGEKYPDDDGHGHLVLGGDNGDIIFCRPAE